MWRQHQRLRRLWTIVPKSGLCGWLIQCDLLLTAGISTLSRFQRRLLPRSLCLSGLPRWCKEGAQLWCTQCTLPWCKTQCTLARCTPSRCKTARCTTSGAHKVPTKVHTKVYNSWCTLPIAPGRVWQSLALQRMLLSGFLEPSFTAIGLGDFKEITLWMEKVKNYVRTVPLEKKFDFANLTQLYDATTGFWVRVLKW